MLSRDQRLRKSSDITRLYKTGQYAGVGALSMRYGRGRSVIGSRMTVVVAKKVSKKAVVRNRIRRQLAALLREWYGQFGGQNDIKYDIVVTVHQDTTSLSPAELRDLTQRLLVKAGILT